MLRLSSKGKFFTIAFGAVFLLGTLYWAYDFKIRDGGGIQFFNLTEKGTKPGEFVQLDATKSFSVIAIPDTQKYAKYYPEIFCAQTNWIVESQKKLNTVFALHLGDIVDSGKKSPKEWQVATNCMSLLDGVVPYSVIPGNHDTDIVSKTSSGFSAYNKNFPKSKFEKYDWYKGGFKNNQNNYEVVESQGREILFLNLEIEAKDDVVAWANKILDENKDKFVILSTHKYLYDDGKGRNSALDFDNEGNTGEDIWQKIVKNNCNVRLVLSGHYHKKDGEEVQIDKNNCEQDVPQIIQDYQSREMGGGGTLRVYTFTPNKNKVEVRTYSPYTDTFEIDSNSEFELEIIF